MTVLPAWLDQMPNVSFEGEKALLEQLETWAQKDGWIVSDGDTLPQELRQRTDVLFEHPKSSDRIRLAVLVKSHNGAGSLRLDSSEFRTLELVYQPRKRRWRVIAGNVPIEDDLYNRDWNWLTHLLLAP